MLSAWAPLRSVCLRLCAGRFRGRPKCLAVYAPRPRGTGNDSRESVTLVCSRSALSCSRPVLRCAQRMFLCVAALRNSLRLTSSSAAPVPVTRRGVGFFRFVVPQAFALCGCLGPETQSAATARR
ncbi:hypothetical protein TRVL_02011 [Trypanosoma vivax]|nr:hypothetical protein TRVL_02011 [Trypanosoma vivax]